MLFMDGPQIPWWLVCLEYKTTHKGDLQIACVWRYPLFPGYKNQPLSWACPHSNFPASFSGRVQLELCSGSRTYIHYFHLKRLLDFNILSILVKRGMVVNFRKASKFGINRKHQGNFQMTTIFIALWETKWSRLVLELVSLHYLFIYYFWCMSLRF